jgi:hypothetical protein
MWEPHDEGISTKKAAVEWMRGEQKRWPEERFAIVKTVNTRLVSPRAKATGK